MAYSSAQQERLVPNFPCLYAALVAGDRRRDIRAPGRRSSFAAHGKHLLPGRVLLTLFGNGVEWIPVGKGDPRFDPDGRKVFNDLVEPCEIVFALLLLGTRPSALETDSLDAEFLQMRHRRNVIPQAPIQALHAHAETRLNGERHTLDDKNSDCSKRDSSKAA